MQHYANPTMRVDGQATGEPSRGVHSRRVSPPLVPDRHADVSTPAITKPPSGDGADRYPHTAYPHTLPFRGLLAPSYATWTLPSIPLGGAAGSGRRPRSFITSALFRRPHTHHYGRR